MSDRYQDIRELPETLAVFPIRGAILLPRATLTLNVFEPRYLAMVDYALANERFIGIVQPAPETGTSESPDGKAVPLRDVGCLGRVTAFSEEDDGRLTIALSGLARFQLGSEVASDMPFRLFEVGYLKYEADLVTGYGEDRVDRARLLETLRHYLDANNLSADWERIDSASSERLVNMLAILSPFGPEEKQALLEATDLCDRAEALVALAEMDLATRDDDSGTTIQ